MTKVTRSDFFVRDETGPAWFNDFLRSFSGAKSPNVLQEIIDAITNKKLQTVEGLVQDYKEQVGLDMLGSIDDEEILKQASTKKVSEPEPITPMKLKKVESIDDVLKDYASEDLIIQIKFDGWKTMGIKKDGKVRLYTRRANEFTENVPEVVDQLDKLMPDNSFILGELVWEDKTGKQSISDIQTIASSSPEKAHKKIKEGGGKVIFYVYDLLWENGENITKQKYIERYSALKGIVDKKENINIVDNYTWVEKDKAMKDAVSRGAEGIVIKPKDSEYKYAALGENEPIGDWYKYKKGVKSHIDEVILNKYHKDTDKLIFPAYQYKGKELFEVGNLSGMNKEDEAKIKKDIDFGKEVVVEVTYQERMESGKFRHMGWSRFRNDKSVKEVKVSKTIFKPLSIRHAEDKINIVDIIKDDKQLSADIESYCIHSGGTKSTSAIINYIRSQLRKKLGDEIVVRFADEDLKNYIESLKKEKKHNLADLTRSDVGRVGTETESCYDDNVADYMNHSPK